MSDCIFCKIAAGQIPVNKLYESENFIAFLDISPANKGHALIVPKKHSQSFTELNAQQAKEFGELQLKLAKAVMKVTQAQGFNLLLNDGRAAGQEVMHTHMHIMPRFETDDFKFRWTHKKYDEGEMQKYFEQIKGSL